MEYVALQSLRILYHTFILLSKKPATFVSNVVDFPMRNINIYKIRKLRVFSIFYDISPLNFAILLNLRCSFQL